MGSLITPSAAAAGLAQGWPAHRDCLPPARRDMSCLPMAKKTTAPQTPSIVQSIRVGSESRWFRSMAPYPSEPNFVHDANIKKYNKNKFLYVLTFAAPLQCFTLVATTLLINDTLNNLEKTTVPTTTRPMTGTSRPGKWSSMLTEDEAVQARVRAVPERRLEGHSGAESEFREVFKHIYITQYLKLKAHRSCCAWRSLS